MKLFPRLAVALVLATAMCRPASAASIQERGTIIMTQGHESPACRTVGFRRGSDNQILLLRIPSAAQDNAMLALTLTAITQRLKVDIIYDPAVTTGCGGEPKIQAISLVGSGLP